MSMLNPDAHCSPRMESVLYDLTAELLSEIFSSLGAHDQMNMKRVCTWWRLNLSKTYLSRLVDMDDVTMFNQSEDLLEQALNRHIQKNTKILVLRHINFKFATTKFGLIARVIKKKHADLIQLILKDCEVEHEFAAAACLWVFPQLITDRMVHGLIFATRKLILENYTVQNALNTFVMTWMGPVMPGPGMVPRTSRRNFSKLPIVLTRLELDCTKPFHQHYHSFIMALESSCPEVNPQVRNDVVLLYNSWIKCEAEKSQWRSLVNLIKWLNQGVPVRPYHDDDLDLDISALGRLDPLTFNKLTIEAIYRLYF